MISSSKKITPYISLVIVIQEVPCLIILRVREHDDMGNLERRIQQQEAGQLQEERSKKQKDQRGGHYRTTHATRRAWIWKMTGSSKVRTETKE